MEELKSTKVDWKKLAVVSALVFLTAVTVGGLTWYVATAGAQDEIEAYKNDIVRLETEIKQLQAEETETEKDTTQTVAKATDDFAGLKSFCDITAYDDIKSVTLAETKDGQFARCKIEGGLDGTSITVAKKVNNSWVVIKKGFLPLTKEQIDNNNIPDSIYLDYPESSNQ
jgi:hypothetical protein